MPLNSVSVALDDNDHTRLDRLILVRDALPDYPPMQLMLIVGNSDGMLDQRYLNIKEVDKLLEKYPELQDRIKTAYEAQSFKDIRTLGMFISENPGKCYSLPCCIQKYFNHRSQKDICTHHQLMVSRCIADPFCALS